jgi:hypothetical protein
MNERIKQLAEQATIRGEEYLPGNDGHPTPTFYFDKEKFAELIVRECLGIVKSNTYGPAGEYDYSYSDKSAAADERAETIHEEIAYHFGVEE